MLKDSLKAIEEVEMPLNLNEAVNSLQANEYLKKLLGEEMHQHLWAFYNLEYTEFMNQIDEWELNRYLFNI
jgi:glutamine synthetase